MPVMIILVDAVVPCSPRALLGHHAAACGRRSPPPAVTAAAAGRLAQVDAFDCLRPPAIPAGDILTLLESEREARRLR